MHVSRMRFIPYSLANTHHGGSRPTRSQVASSLSREKGGHTPHARWPSSSPEVTSREARASLRPQLISKTLSSDHAVQPAGCESCRQPETKWPTQSQSSSQRACARAGAGGHAAACIPGPGRRRPRGDTPADPACRSGVPCSPENVHRALVFSCYPQGVHPSSSESQPAGHARYGTMPICRGHEDRGVARWQGSGGGGRMHNLKKAGIVYAPANG
jgi:hypothetical protein